MAWPACFRHSLISRRAEKGSRGDRKLGLQDQCLLPRRIGSRLTTPMLPSSSCAPAQSLWNAPLYIHVARLVIIPAVLYMLFLASLMIPVIRRHMLFLHKARWPLYPEFDNPELFGFAPNRVRNFHLRTPDGFRIGMWHVLPLSVTNRYSADEALPDSVFVDSLRDSKHCVMLYMHGNAGNRVQGHRKHLARHVSSSPLDMNFVTFDYRGFGDSSDVNPSEEGLLIDTRSVWDWLTQDMMVPPSQIVVAGQSLGTGVACALAGRSLASEGVAPRALILTAPFTSIRDLLLTYKLAETIPVLQPLRYFTNIREYLFGFLDAHFNTLSVIRDIRCPILLIHCIKDGTIPYAHSERLFEHLCQDTTRTAGRACAMETKSIGHYARLDKLASPEPGLDVQFLEMHFGGHDNVGYSEVALQTMKSLIFDR